MKSDSFFSNSYAAAKEGSTEKRGGRPNSGPNQSLISDTSLPFPLLLPGYSLGEKMLCQLVCASLCCSILHLKAGLQHWDKKCFVKAISICPSLIFTGWKTCPASFNYSPVFREKAGQILYQLPPKLYFFFPPEKEDCRRRLKMKSHIPWSDPSTLQQEWWMA